MKKAFCALICILLLSTTGACGIFQKVEDQNTPSPSASESPLISSSASPSASAQDEQPTQTPIGMSPYPSNTAKMYSSYARMVSFDPARGWADFDYFEMLKGNDAVQWLVDKEGYTLAKAQAEVADYADSEFIEKNTNPQLRTIDLREIPLKLIYKSDGTMVETGINGDIGDLFDLYQHNKSLVLDTNFYYIEVKNGEVVAVNQVYWP